MAKKPRALSVIDADIASTQDKLKNLRTERKQAEAFFNKQASENLFKEFKAAFADAEPGLTIEDFTKFVQEQIAAKKGTPIAKAEPKKEVKPEPKPAAKEEPKPAEKPAEKKDDVPISKKPNASKAFGGFAH